MPYKVEVKCIYGWDDAEWTVETDEGSLPLLFESEQEAQAGLIEFFSDVKAAVALGQMNTEENPAYYRIVHVRM